MKKGFTLIELLAVIVILGVLVVIAVPQVLKVIDNAKKGAFESDAKLVIDAIGKEEAVDDTFNSTTIDEDRVSSVLGLSNDNYQDIQVTENDGVASIVIVGKNKWNGLTAYGTFDDMRVVYSDDYDVTSPLITFGTNGNSTYAKSRSTTVTINDAHIDILKYEWTTSTTTPTEGSFSSTFTNGDAISTPAGVTGSYYLWVLAKDKSSNTTILGSNVFNLDNTIPVITMLGSSPVMITQGGTYTDAGATASDNINGNITANIQTTGSVNINVSGAYTITYNVSDTAGNNAVSVVRTVNVIEGDYLASEGVNKPKLATGMTAVKWNTSTSTWDTVSNPDTDTSWYDYTNKQWANAKTADGSFWVWIPRYVYKISSGWHSSTTGIINIQFSMGIDDTRGGTVTLDTGTTSNASNNKWTNHPAFTFGGTQLTGIWVAKFEASVSDTSSVCYTNPNDTDCNNLSLLPKSVPNASSWRYVKVGNAFTASRNMETNNTYGWGTSGSNIDTHLIKNVEWGAALYLSMSSYGQGSSSYVWMNPTYYITGCAGSSQKGSQSWCSYTYDTSYGFLTSTTGTIYGIYDMNGDTYELVSAYVNNSNSILNANGASIISANAKYKDIYTMGTGDAQDANYNLTVNTKGDGMWEISGTNTGSYVTWFQGMAYMVYGNNPWISRGSTCQLAAYASMADFYAFAGTGGGIGFRPVLLVASGL